MSLVSKPYTFSSGATIIAAEHNANFDTLYNDYNGNISNVNVANNAAIHESKLDLSTIAQDIDFTGTVSFTAATVDFSAFEGTYILFNETSAPATGVNQGAIYTKEAGGQTELFYREESSGDEVQITSNGLISAANQTKITVDGTWTCPVGITSVMVTVVGAGGGGGGGANFPDGRGGGGGGAGGYVQRLAVAVTPSTTYTMQVGVGGTGGIAGGINGGDGTAGTDSIFDTTGAAITAEGGGWGKGGQTNGAGSGTGGIGGNSLDDHDGGWDGSDITAGSVAQAGGDGWAPLTAGGGAGSNPYGQGGIGGNTAVNYPTAGTGYGGGGGGGQGFRSTVVRAGADGADGAVILEY